MKVGSLVKGRCVHDNLLDDYALIVCGETRNGLLCHKLVNSLNSKDRRDTLQLWDPRDLFGMVVKIDSDISGYGYKLVQVLLGEKTLWFFIDDLELVNNSNKTTKKS